MSKRTLNGSVALTKLPQAVIIEKKGKSGIIKGVFLPIEGNSMTEKDGVVYMDVRVVLHAEEDKYGNHGFIAKAVPSSVYKEKKDDSEFMDSQQPILGNVKDFSFASNSAPVETFEENDELPF